MYDGWLVYSLGVTFFLGVCIGMLVPAIIIFSDIMRWRE